MLKIGFFWLVNFKYFVLIFNFCKFGVFCLRFKKESVPKIPINYTAVEAIKCEKHNILHRK